MATRTPPSIGIIGAGELGSNIARGMAARGVAATISNRRGPASLAALVDKLGPSITAGTTEEAAAADVVVAAVRWVDAPGIFANLPAWEGRIVVDGTNAVEFLEPGSPETQDPNNPLAGRGLKPVDLGGETSSRVFSRLVPGARVVRAFNHLDVSLLSRPEASGGRRVLFYSNGQDRRGDHLRVPFGHLGQTVAHELDPAPLPGRALQDGGDRVGEAAVAVGDDQLHLAEVTLPQAAQELGIHLDRVNINGGAIAVDHPVGMSGARLVLHLALELGRMGGSRLGAAALCGGGGMGDAIILRVGGN
jgi:predicted dinucleotide-binding enzyme